MTNKNSNVKEEQAQKRTTVISRIDKIDNEIKKLKDQKSAMIDKRKKEIANKLFKIYPDIINLDNNTLNIIFNKLKNIKTST